MSPLPAVFKKFLVVVLASAFGLCLAVVADFTISLFWRPSRGSAAIEKPYVAREHGWYELRPNFSGADQFGPYIYAVETDAHGFRRKPGTAPAPADTIFLGDSFVYGMNGAWEDTFVGMYADDSRRSVINAGVASYSPTAYVHQYRKALDANLLARDHVVVVGIDISDVQDEAGIWIDGDVSPRKRIAASATGPQAATGGVEIPADGSLNRRAVGAAPLNSVDLRATLIDALPNTWAVYRTVRYDLLRWNRASITELPRSAFTYREWMDLDQRPAAPGLEGYAPLGVRGGLERIEAKLLEIASIAAEFDARVYLLIYPWPAQLAHEDRFSWSAFIAEVCRKSSCAGVIDTIPTFRRIAAKEWSWLNTYYVSGDTHFTPKGNRVVADALVQGLRRPVAAAGRLIHRPRVAMKR